MSVSNPDVKLIVRSRSNSLEIELHAPDGTTCRTAMDLKRSPEKVFQEHFSEIPAANTRELGKIGTELAGSLLKDLGMILAEISRYGESEAPSLWIQSEEPWIPWELLRLPKSSSDIGFQGPFLGESFAVARWLDTFPPISHSSTLPLKKLALITPKYDYKKKALNIAYEKAFIGHHVEVESVSARKDTVETTLAKGAFDGWHFSGHGGVPRDDLTASELLLEDEPLRPRDLHRGMLSTAPLVFLNACHSGRTGFSLSGVGGWAPAFLEAGAGAFLGAYWAVSDPAAVRFSEVFYKAFLRGVPIAAAVREARLSIREDNDPTWLAYSLFAHPLAIREGAVRQAAIKPQEGEEVAVVAKAVEPSASGKIEPSPIARSAERGQRRASWSRAAAVLILVASTVVLGLVFWPSPVPTVAVLGKVDSQDTSDHWMSVAVAEMLSTALALDGDVHVLPAEVVARRLTDLRPEASFHDADDMERLSGQLGAGFLVHATLRPTHREGTAWFELDLRLQTAEQIETIALPGGASDKLHGLIFGAARKLHRALDVGPLEVDQERWLSEIFPADPEALRLYFTGLGKLWMLDFNGAHQDLEQALSHATDHPILHLRLARAAENIGDLNRARRAIQRAHELSGPLPPREKLIVQARFHELREDKRRARQAYETLRSAFPHDPEPGLLLADVQIASSLVPAALETLHSLRQSRLSPLNEAEANLLEAEAHLRGGDHEAAHRALARALDRAQGLDARFLEARARLVEATLFERDFAKSFQALELARILFETPPKHQKGIWTAFEKTYILVYQEQGPSAAREFLESLKEEYLEKDDLWGEAVIRNNLGLALTALWELETAQEELRASHDIFERLGARHESAVVANNLGIAYHYGEDLERAREHYAKARDTFTDLGQQRATALIWTNLGEIDFAEGKLREAESKHKTARDLNRELQDLIGESYDLYRLGIVRTALGTQESLEDAKKDFERSLNILAEAPHGFELRQQEADTRIAYAHWAITTHNFGQAAKLAEEAEGIFWEMSKMERSVIDQALLAQILRLRIYLDQPTPDIEKARALLERTREHALQRTNPGDILDQIEALSERLAKLERLP